MHCYRVSAGSLLDAWKIPWAAADTWKFPLVVVCSFNGAACPCCLGLLATGPTLRGGGFQGNKTHTYITAACYLLTKNWSILVDMIYDNCVPYLLLNGLKAVYILNFGGVLLFLIALLYIWRLNGEQKNTRVHVMPWHLCIFVPCPWYSSNSYSASVVVAADVRDVYAPCWWAGGTFPFKDKCDVLPCSLSAKYFQRCFGGMDQT